MRCSPGGCTTTTPSGFAVGGLTFSAIAKLMNADALEDAERAMDGLRADAEEMGRPDLIAGALWQQAQIAYQRGDLPRCELEARGAIEAGGDFARGLVTPWLVMVLAEQGRLDEAEGLLEKAGLLGPIPPSILLTAALGSRGRLRMAQGDAGRAVEDLGSVLDRNAAYEMQRVEPPWRPLRAEALVLADRTKEAAEEAETYAAAGGRVGYTAGAGARRPDARARRASRTSIALLEEARTHFAASHARLELARCLTDLGSRRRAAGERRAARTVLRDAHDAAHACRATALCERARAELLLAGGRPRPAAGAGVGALTPAERRVADIAASGATNREIARRLYLSPKTVEMHLRTPTANSTYPDGTASPPRCTEPLALMIPEAPSARHYNRLAAFGAISRREIAAISRRGEHRSPTPHLVATTPLTTSTPSGVHARHVVRHGRRRGELPLRDRGFGYGLAADGRRLFDRADAADEQAAERDQRAQEPATISVARPDRGADGAGQRERERQQADRDQPIQARNAAEHARRHVALLGRDPDDRAGGLERVEDRARKHQMPDGGAEPVTRDRQGGERPDDVDERHVAAWEARPAGRNAVASEASPPAAKTSPRSLAVALEVVLDQVGHEHLDRPHEEQVGDGRARECHPQPWRARGRTPALAQVGEQRSQPGRRRAARRPAA